VPLGGIQTKVLNSRLPACTNGCGLDTSIGCFASTRANLASSVVATGDDRGAQAVTILDGESEAFIKIGLDQGVSNSGDAGSASACQGSGVVKR
jgi:hypothetical protein